MDCCLTKHETELEIEPSNGMHGRRFVVGAPDDDLYSNLFAYRPGYMYATFVKRIAARGRTDPGTPKW
jgi:hypothetical protein